MSLAWNRPKVWFYYGSEIHRRSMWTGRYQETRAIICQYSLYIIPPLLKSMQFHVFVYSIIIFPLARIPRYLDFIWYRFVLGLFTFGLLLHTIDLNLIWLWQEDWRDMEIHREENLVLTSVNVTGQCCSLWVFLLFITIFPQHSLKTIQNRYKCQTTCTM